MLLFELVAQHADASFSSSLWTKAVINALHEAHVDTLHTTFVNDLHSLDRLCHQWFVRYGGTRHLHQHTELDDHTTLLVPIVERLSMLHAALGDWRVPTNLLPSGTLSLEQEVALQTSSGSRQSAGHRLDITSPLPLAASILLDDASRNWRSAAALMQQLSHTSVEGRPSAAIVNSRAKDAFRRFQVAFASSSAVLALPLTNAELVFDATRLRDISGACAAAAQYFFASTREGSSEQHALLASLSAYAAQLCVTCRRFGEEWDSVVGSVLSAASYKHRADAALAPSLKNPRVIPDMPLVLGLLLEAKRHMFDALVDNSPATHHASARRLLLARVFPTSLGLQHDINTLLLKEEHENAIVYHEKPMLRHQLGSVDIDKHDSKPANIKLYEKSLEWSTSFRGGMDVNVLHNREMNPFLKFGPTAASFQLQPVNDDVGAVVAPQQQHPSGESSQNDDDDDDDDDDAFQDAESAEDALHRLLQTDLPSAVAAVVLDDVPSYTQMLRDVLSAVQGFQLREERSTVSTNDDTVPWWLVSMGNTLGDELSRLRADLGVLHEERKRFITANVQSPDESLNDVERELQTWFANTRPLLSKDCTTHLPVTSTGGRRFVEFAGLHVDYVLRHCPEGPVLVDALKALRLLLASADSTWSALFEGAVSLAHAHDVAPSTYASFQLLLNTARQSWTASRVSTVYIKRYLQTMFVDAGRLRELCVEGAAASLGLSRLNMVGTIRRRRVTCTRP
ncbi:Hypothetical protein, putative [Bodo saltans]|uniref:Uncharacterized protein n=1 Tax=Bodo saltans TaxID=75058 RepID=A0A0S4JQV8_BODSA|nr:Hypothetical protein, putative [Bodo saltans]|eukprot:CUG92642.1 Hypothetical protein, putative [Bodo saltans]